MLLPGITTPARQETTATIPATLSATGGLTNIPNPFKESTTTGFLYQLQAGNHQTIFASHSIPAGIYLRRMVYNGKIVTKKLLKK